MPCYDSTTGQVVDDGGNPISTPSSEMAMCGGNGNMVSYYPPDTSDPAAAASLYAGQYDHGGGEHEEGESPVVPLVKEGAKVLVDDAKELGTPLVGALSQNPAFQAVSKAYGAIAAPVNLANGLEKMNNATNAAEATEGYVETCGGGIGLVGVAGMEGAGPVGVSFAAGGLAGNALAQYADSDAGGHTMDWAVSAGNWAEDTFHSKALGAIAAGGAGIAAGAVSAVGGAARLLTGAGVQHTCAGVEGGEGSGPTPCVDEAVQ